MKQSTIVDKETSLPDALDAFYAQFEQNASSAVSPALTAPDAPVPTVTAADVRSVFLGVNPRKAMGLDGVLRRVLSPCADQLVEVFTDSFNLSLLQAEVPTCFRKTTIILYLRKHMQSTADAISLALHSSLEHLDKKDTYVRLLLIDYSFAFNTTIPSRLISKLQSHIMLAWIYISSLLAQYSGLCLAPSVHKLLQFK
eukprot:g42090.t1